MPSLESLACQIARGLARGWVEGCADVLSRAHTATEEAATPTDLVRADRFRAAVRRVLRIPGDPGPEYPPQDIPPGDAVGMAEPARRNDDGKPR